jgi:hypothetical protein
VGEGKEKGEVRREERRNKWGKGAGKSGEEMRKREGIYNYIVWVLFDNGCVVFCIIGVV